MKFHFLDLDSEEFVREANRHYGAAEGRRYLYQFTNEVSNIINNNKTFHEDWYSAKEPLIYRHNGRTFVTDLPFLVYYGATTEGTVGTVMVGNAVEIGCICCGSGLVIEDDTWQTCNLCR